MNSLHSYLGTLAILVFFAAPLNSEISPKRDRFRKLFELRAPIEDIIVEITTINARTNYEHFKVIQQHIKKNDEYASYAKTIIATGQKMLDYVLREIKYDKKMDFAKFIDSAYEIAFGPSLPDEETIDLLLRINSYLRKMYKEALKITTRKITDKLLDTVAKKDASQKQPTKSANVSKISSGNPTLKNTSSRKRQRGKFNKSSSRP